ncbi:MAG: transposase [Methanomicrobiales archaeon]|nr:transposase [Methanomicrobiales archaeon]
MLLDYRLNLPESWTSDRGRCDASGIPPEFQRFKTKAELAFELIC